MAGLESASAPSGSGWRPDFCTSGEISRLCAARLMETRGIPDGDAGALAEKILAEKIQHPVNIDALLEVMRVLECTKLSAVKEEVYKGVCQMFSSVETLYWSFYRGDEGEGPQGISFGELSDFYAELMAMKDEVLGMHVVERVHEMIMCTRTSERGLLALLMLLMNPLLAEIEHRKVLKAVLKKVCSIMTKEHKKVLVRQIASLKHGQLRQLLIMLHQHLTITLYEEDKPEVALKHALDVLSLLFKANQDSSALKHEDFYISAVNGGDLDIEEDFKRWLKGGETLSFCNYPFVYDSGTKAQIMNLENNQTQGRVVEDWLLDAIHSIHAGTESICPFLVLRVRRGEALLRDTIDQIQAAKASGSLKRPLKVQFVGEAGVDEGGVAKEFFQLLLRTLFDPNYGMFVYDEDTRLWWFRPSALDLSEEFELFGVVLGIAIFNNHILDLQFPSVVYKQLLGHKTDFSDLKSVFPDVHMSMSLLLNMPTLDGLELFFEVERDMGMEGMVTTELVENGSSLQVTCENRMQYVTLYSEFLLEKSVQKQFKAFRQGFLSVCESRSLKMFLPEELEDAACGKQILDVDALEAATVYMDGYTSSHKVIKWFWGIVRTFSENKRRSLLSFVTGSDRVPIRGFAALNPKFTISRAGDHSARLPTARTCFNHLMFPEYKDRESMKTRLDIAIDNAEGFGMM